MAFQEDAFQQDLIQIVSDADSSPLTSIPGLAETQPGTINLGSVGTEEHDTAPVRTATDALSLGDVVARTGTFLRTTADALSLADAVVAIKITPRTVADALGLADSATRQVTLFRAATDALSLSDTTTRQATLARTASDGLSLSDVAIANVISGAKPYNFFVWID